MTCIIAKVYLILREKISNCSFCMGKNCVELFFILLAASIIMLMLIQSTSDVLRGTFTTQHYLVCMLVYCCIAYIRVYLLCKLAFNGFLIHTRMYSLAHFIY